MEAVEESEEQEKPLLLVTPLKRRSATLTKNKLSTHTRGVFVLGGWLFYGTTLSLRESHEVRRRTVGQLIVRLRRYRRPLGERTLVVHRRPRRYCYPTLFGLPDPIQSLFDMYHRHVPTCPLLLTPDAQCAPRPLYVRNPSGNWGPKHISTSSPRIKDNSPQT